MSESHTSFDRKRGQRTGIYCTIDIANGSVVTALLLLFLILSKGRLSDKNIPDLKSHTFHIPSSISAVIF